MTTRLANVLRWQNLRLLGDLHGLSLFKISTFRNCGRRTIDDLRQLVRRVQGEATPERELPAAPPDPESAILIPAYAAEFRPQDLPISVRLGHVFGAKGITRLGDLQGCRLREFLALPHCGQRTVEELAGLIERLVAGEWQPLPGGFSPAPLAEALRCLDQAVAALPATWRRMLLLRLGNESPLGATLDEIGKSAGRTRERVRQIETMAVQEIYRAVAVKTKPQWDAIARLCAEKVCPLRPELLAYWLIGTKTRLQYSPAVYVRLLGKLEPAIPIWSRRARLPRSRNFGCHEEIARGVRAILREGPPMLPLPEAWKRVRERMRENGPDLPEFFEALKRNRSLAVNFQTPDEGTVRLCQRPVGRPRRG